MHRCATLLSVISLGASAQALEPSYTRAGFDYFSAPVEPPQTRSVPTQCEKLYGKHTELEKLEKTWRCSVTTASEPRLSTRLNEEIALAEQFPEPKRQKVVDTLVDKYKRLAQCPSGTAASHDGSMYWCVKIFSPKDLCPSGAPGTLESGEVGCVTNSCAAGFTDLASVTRGERAGCFKCPKGAYDGKETEAFHGALKGLPGPFTDVFCKVAAK